MFPATATPLRYVEIVNANTGQTAGLLMAQKGDRSIRREKARSRRQSLAPVRFIDLTKAQADECCAHRGNWVDLAPKGEATS